MSAAELAMPYLKKRPLILSLLIVPISVSSLNAQSSIKPFLGRWDLTLKTPTQELPAWIEIYEEQGQPRILMVGVSDHATPLPQVQVKEGEIEFPSVIRSRAASWKVEEGTLVHTGRGAEIITVPKFKDSKLH